MQVFRYSGHAVFSITQQGKIPECFIIAPNVGEQVDTSRPCVASRRDRLFLGHRCIAGATVISGAIGIVDTEVELHCGIVT